MPSRDQYLDSLHRDAELFEAAVRAGGDLSQPVDGCPGWDLAALVEHIGTLHRYITEGIESGGKPAGGSPAAPAERATFADWFADGAAALEAALRARPDDEPCWTFFPNAPQTIGT